MKLFLLTTAMISMVTFQAFAEMPEDTSTRVMRASKLSCEELEDHMHRLNQIVTEAGDAKANHNMMGAAAGAGTQAAVMAGAGSSIPFVGGLFNAATSMTGASAENKERLADEADNEISRLTGIAEAKGCM